MYQKSGASGLSLKNGLASDVFPLASSSDQTILSVDSGNSKSPFKNGNKYGATIFKAQTIGDLATAAGINGYLATTVKDYNAAIANGTIATASVPRIASAQALATAPFYAMPIRIGTWGTYGGLVTNAKAAILDLDSNPIPGLYGSGTVMEGGLSGGVPGGGYVGCIGTGLIWGLISAESAAAYAKALV